MPPLSSVAFVNLAILGFMGALAVPVIIHLIRARHRYRPATLGTLRFLQEALRETAPRRRVWNWLLLILRLLAVAAAVLLFARPFRPGSEPASGVQWLVLLDASGSMNVRSAGTSHFELAVRRARRLAASAGAGQKVRVWLCGDDIREPSAGELEGGLAGVVPAGRVDWPAALRRAAVTLASSTAAHRRVLILTDMQRRDLPAAQKAESLPRWPAQTTFEVQSLLAGDWNAEVVSASRQPQTGANLAVTIALHGVAPPEASLPLEVSVDGERAARATVPAVSGVVQVALPRTANPGGKTGEPMAEIHLDANDCLPQDDRFWLPLSPPRPAPVWLVAEQSGQASRFASETYFLEKALEVVPAAGEAAAFAPVRAHAAGGALRPQAGSVPAPQGAVVLADCGAPEAATLPALASAMEAGLGLVVFMGPRSSDGACAAALARSGLLPAAPAPRSLNEEQAVQWWDVSHPTLARYDLDRLDLASLRLVSRHDLAPAAKAGARPLMRLADDSVVMVEAVRGKGRLLVVSASPTRRDSDWVVQRAFAPLVRQWVAHAGGAAAKEGGWTVIDRRFTDRPGFGPDFSGRRILRFPEGEGDLTAVAEEQFRAALRLPARAPAVAAAELSPPPARASRPGEWWPWFAVGLLVLATAETRLADRRARRRL